MNGVDNLESLSNPKFISGSVRRAIISQENPQLTPGSNTTDKCVSGGGAQLVHKTSDGPGLSHYTYRLWDQDNEWTDKNGYHLEYINVRLNTGGCGVDMPI